MAISPISRLPKDERQQLLDDLNYLNLSEMKSFCRRQAIPYTIAVETKAGQRKKTKEDDRKGVILNRMRHYLQTGLVSEETYFQASVVCFDAPPERPTPNDRLFYGQYDKTNKAMIALLKDLTNGKFQDGAIARILLREFWAKGKAPTCKEFSSAWLLAVREHTGPNAEWAFLSDRARNSAVKDWKKWRATKASKVTKVLNRIVSR
jgi:hypothetical protein